MSSSDNETEAEEDSVDDNGVEEVEEEESEEVDSVDVEGVDEAEEKEVEGEDLADVEESGESEEEQRYIRLYGAYLLGTNFEYVRRAVNENYPVRQVENEGGKMLLDTLETIEYILRVSDLESSVERDLERTINRFSDKYDVPERHEDYDTLDDEDASDLKSQLDTWERLLEEELLTTRRYPSHHSGIMKIDDLVESTEILFEEMNIWDELPEKVKDDLDQSIQCLAFNAPTGSVFLALRAVEDRLREWYEVETGRNIGDRTFGQVIGELDDHYDDSDKPLILTHLNYLKDMRNEVAHPERSPDIREAESTLINVRQTIYQIQDQLD